MAVSLPVPDCHTAVTCMVPSTWISLYIGVYARKTNPMLHTSPELRVDLTIVLHPQNVPVVPTHILLMFTKTVFMPIVAKSVHLSQFK